MADEVTLHKPLSPLVSVVTAFYNEERFLEETIVSVVNQTYGNWELILVDDGSPDKSRAIASDYAARYPGKIILLHHPGYVNQGVCKSRNLGVAAAKGEYVAYLDADDVWLSDKLEKQLRIFESFPDTTVLLEASTYWYSWEDNQKHDVVIQIGTTPDKLYSPPELMINLYPLGDGAAPCPSGMMVRKKIHDHISFVEDFVGDTAVYEDQAFLTQIYLSEMVYVSSQANNLYRQRASSQVFNVHHDGRYHYVRGYYLSWLEAFLGNQNYHHSGVEDLLRKALFPYRYPLVNRIKAKLSKLLKRI